MISLNNISDAALDRIIEETNARYRRKCALFEKVKASYKTYKKYHFFKWFYKSKYLEAKENAISVTNQFTNIYRESAHWTYDMRIK